MPLSVDHRWEGPDFILAGPSLTPPGAALEQPDGPSIQSAGMLVKEDQYGQLGSVKANFMLTVPVLLQGRSVKGPKCGLLRSMILFWFLFRGRSVKGAVSQRVKCGLFNMSRYWV